MYVVNPKIIIYFDTSTINIQCIRDHQAMQMLYPAALFTYYVYVCPCAAWLVSCRIIAIIALILQVAGVVMVVILLIWVLCEAMRCCDDDAGWCDRCIIYLTPIIWVLAGMLQ